MIEVHAEVVVKGLSGGLLEAMEAAVGRLKPNMLVMGSAALTMVGAHCAGWQEENGGKL